MGAMSRSKGKAGEREVAGLLRDLLGLDIRRRVRQHDGDSDLEGVPGWSVEVKRRSTATRGEVASWWAQAVQQAQDAGQLPVLLFRADRSDSRASRSSRRAPAAVGTHRPGVARARRSGLPSDALIFDSSIRWGDFAVDGAVGGGAIAFNRDTHDLRAVT